MKIIALTNQKGGCAKTTTALNLGASLAKLGKKVLLIDIDPQANLTSGLGISTEEKTLYNCLVNDLQIEEIILKTNYENLDIVPSNILLSNAEIELSNVIGRETVLKTLFKKTKGLDYDYIILDCNPSLGLLTINALSASDEIIIPMEAAIFSFQGIESLVKTIHLIQEKINDKLNICGVLLTRVNSRANISKEFENKLKEIFKDKVFNTVIHQNVAIVESQLESIPVIEYDPKSNGAKEYLLLAEEVINRA